MDKRSISLMVTDPQKALEIRRQITRTFANNSEHDVDTDEENDQFEMLSERPRKAIYRQQLKREYTNSSEIKLNYGINS